MRYLIITSLLLASATSMAQTIGNWTLNNTLAGTGSAHTSVGAMSAGPGVSTTAYNGGTEWYGQNGFPAGASPNTNAYLQFTVSPNTGYELNVASIVLRMRRSNTGGPSGSGPTAWCLRSNLDGYSANLAAGTMSHNYANYTVLLAGFSQMPAGVTFRLYGYNVTVPSGGNNRLVLDNVSITGSLFILPLQLQAPEANAGDKGNIDLAWQADDITGGTKFSLQRSADGNSFQAVYDLTENSDKPSQRYTYADKSAPAGWQQLYYRVQALEPDGTMQVSRVVSVSRKIAARFHIEKVFVRGSLVQAVIQVPARGNYTIAIHASNGALMYKQTAVLHAGTQSIPVSWPQPAKGIAVLSVYDNNGIVSRPFVVQ